MIPLTPQLGPSCRARKRACTYPAVASLPEEILCDQGSNLSPLSHARSITKEEASTLPIGQEVLVTGTSQVHCTSLQAGYPLCKGTHMFISIIWTQNQVL